MNRKELIKDLLYVLILTLIFSIKATILISIIASLILLITLLLTNHVYNKNNGKYSKILVIGITTIGLSISYEIVFNDVNLIIIFALFLSTLIIYESLSTKNNRNKEKK